MNEEGKMEERKVTDLLEDAIKYEDYNKMINFLVAGLVCAESNDTPEKEQQNNKYLQDIYDFCENYSGEQQPYFDHLKKTIRDYLSYVD